MARPFYVITTVNQLIELAKRVLSLYMTDGILETEKSKSEMLISCIELFVKSTQDCLADTARRSAKLN